MKHDPPAASAVRDLLDRILSSETFKRSERARSLLAYLVEREQAGEADRLKGYTIAVDVFGRDEEFDSSTDAVVRVQAGRLRELLGHYYETEGCNDPIRIVISRGSYMPSYEAATPCPNRVLSSGVARPSRTVRIASTIAALFSAKPRAPKQTSAERFVGIGEVRLLWGALAVIAALLLIVASQMSSVGDMRGNVVDASAAPAATVARPARLEALPTIRIVTDGDDPDVVRVAALFRTAFASFDTIEMIGGEYSGREPRLPVSPGGFVLSVASGAAEGSVLLELQCLASGRVLVNRALSALQTGSGALENEVASLVNAVAPVNGVIYGYLKQNGLQSELVNCLILNDAFYLEWTQPTHLAAYRCFERLMAAHARSPLVYATLASLRTSAKTDGFAYPPNPYDEGTMALAQRAVQVGPTSPYAHGAMGYFYSQRGDSTEALRWMRKAYELNTFDLGMAAAYGYTLVFSRKYGEGAAILRRAVDLSSVHPPWWDYCLFLAEFMLGDTDKASQATNAFSAVKKPQYLAARLIVAHSLGDERRAGALAAEITVSFPKFAADPSKIMRSYNYPPDLIEKFVDALKVAGIGGAS